ncbi:MULTISPECIES: phospholipase D-like domain-containing protein [unclassified Exiguobacterium]|nr:MULTISPECIES: phospholipase D-like domain-containing protein [unclassified Exiguobacterium]
MLIQIIHTAEKSIYIQSPYFIPDASFMDACRIALASGVTLKIMIPNQPDHPFVYWATYAAVGEELELLFLSDVADSSLLTREKYAARPQMIRFKESISRLLSPIL